MDADAFTEALLAVMEGKVHWAWPAFTHGKVAPDRLHIHLEHEYAVYVRDFAVLIGRAYVQCPVAEVRRELAENLYEEETGGLSKGRPHAELFLEYPRGLGMDLARFEAVQLLPAAADYRAEIDAATRGAGWDVGAAVTTLWLEGTAHERGEIDPTAEKRPEPPLTEHPLVKHYGLPLSSLQLTKVHREVEGSHRASAWRIVRTHVAPDRRTVVVDAMQRVRDRWLHYRDAVAAACGVGRDDVADLGGPS
jgi:pyrroloquinoline-quinone synthase